MRRSIVLLMTLCAGTLVTGQSPASSGTGTTPASAQTTPAPQGPGAPNPNGWQIPDTAASETNPVPATDATMAAGKKIYAEQCQRCHGEEGKGDGPDADPDDMPSDLSNARRAARNPDGVMFYKIWNGRKQPQMPAYSQKLTREQVWTVVQYVKTLRKPQPAM